MGEFSRSEVNLTEPTESFRFYRITDIIWRITTMFLTTPRVGSTQLAALSSDNFGKMQSHDDQPCQVPQICKLLRAFCSFSDGSERIVTESWRLTSRRKSDESGEQIEVGWRNRKGMWSAFRACDKIGTAHSPDLGIFIATSGRRRTTFSLPFPYLSLFFFLLSFTLFFSFTHSHSLHLLCLAAIYCMLWIQSQNYLSWISQHRAGLCFTSNHILLRHIDLIGVLPVSVFFAVEIPSEKWQVFMLLINCLIAFLCITRPLQKRTVGNSVHDSWSRDLVVQGRSIRYSIRQVLFFIACKAKVLGSSVTCFSPLAFLQMRCGPLQFQAPSSNLHLE